LIHILLKNRKKYEFQHLYEFLFSFGYWSI